MPTYRIRKTNLSTITGGDIKRGLHIAVTSNANGLTLSLVRTEDAPVEFHPTTGKPFKTLRVLKGVQDDASDTDFVVCEVEELKIAIGGDGKLAIS